MVKRNFNFLIIILLCTSVHVVKAQSEWTRMSGSLQIQAAAAEPFVRGAVSSQPLTMESVLPLPQGSGVCENPFRFGKLQEDPNHKCILKPGQSLVFEVNGDQWRTDSSVLEVLSEEIVSAISRVPSWMQYDLRYKFRRIVSASVRKNMLALLNGTPMKYLDEVAYQLTYLPVEVLCDGRFSDTWDWLRKNAELIYTHADSLQYVRLVEHGDTAKGDWYTTTEYRIKKNGTYIWREIDRYYYYMFIVMPKIEQEGVYVTDRVSSTGQRTWGYGWREYLWSDPDSAYSYRPVGISGYKVVNVQGNYDTLKVDSVPRFGELMQKPEYLWDENTGIWFFLRDFDSTDHALDVLGNWCSRCIPMDVTNSNDYRPSQPNQIAWKHVGNCHEDALLVAAAARTALIPLMHIGDFCDDHVWGMIHDGGDSIWHHYEFFRGGCSPNRPYYWGMTNMQPTGNYGWNSSLVQGYVPDGTLFNVSDYYTKNTPACDLELTITDADGRPIDGVRVNLYSTNYQYSTSSPSILSAGYLWTDADGVIRAKLGSGNKYYMKLYHPEFGSFPEESGKVYVMINANTVAGKSYKVSYKFQKSANQTTKPSRQEKFESRSGLRLNMDAKNITTDINPVDGQRSTFYQRTGRHAGLSVYVMTEEQYAQKDSALYRFEGLASGSFDIPLPAGGKSYVVLANDRNTVNNIELAYSAAMVESGSFDIVSVKNVPQEQLRIYPNPARTQLKVQTESRFRQAIIYSMDGRCMLTSYTSEINVSEFPVGMYLIRVETAAGVSVQKFIKE